ncbi:MAG: hypothetical protein Fur0037_26030 [Planctomycetota bacterium]
MNRPPIDGRALAPLAQGFTLGLSILLFLVILGLSIGLSASIDFGLPLQ